MAEVGSLPSVMSRPWTTTRASNARMRSGEASSGLMSISLIHGCSTTSWLKRTSRSSNAARSTGLRPRTPFSALRILVCSIMRRARVEFKGGRARPRSSKTSTNCPEQYDRPELLVETAADDQLVTIELHHGLHRHALKVLGANFFGD